MVFGAEHLPKLLEESEKWRKIVENLPASIFIQELTRLNDNAEKLHKDLDQYKPLVADLRVLIGILKDLQEKGKATVFLAKQVSILNQIMAKTSKVAGYSGMFQQLLASIIQMAQKPR